MMNDVWVKEGDIPMEKFILRKLEILMARGGSALLPCEGTAGDSRGIECGVSLGTEYTSVSRRNYRAIMPVERMQGFDSSRYVGVWHELALIPQPYERACDAATAVYTPQGDAIEVRNYCMRGGQVISSISGVAVVDPRYCTPSKLLVRFSPGMIGSYWVLLTDYETFSIVGNEDGSSLWLLSRRQEVDASFRVYLALLCRRLGVSTRSLQWR